jgi:hypothetical protein
MKFDEYHEMLEARLLEIRNELIELSELLDEIDENELDDETYEAIDDELLEIAMGVECVIKEVKSLYNDSKGV